MVNKWLKFSQNFVKKWLKSDCKDFTTFQLYLHPQNMFCHNLPVRLCNGLNLDSIYQFGFKHAHAHTHICTKNPTISIVFACVCLCAVGL